jgi:Tol biopolymer transport system component
VLMRFPAWSPLGNQIVYEQVELTSNVYVTDLK